MPTSALTLLCLCSYAAYLLFQLKTHKHLFMGEDDGEEPTLSIGASMAMLAAITVMVAFSSEYALPACRRSVTCDAAPEGHSPPLNLHWPPAHVKGASWLVMCPHSDQAASLLAVGTENWPRANILRC
jgi:hypothetical protein